LIAFALLLGSGVHAAPVDAATATLTVVKVVNGGTAQASDFKIHVKFAGQESDGSPINASSGGVSFNLNAGTYIISETGGPAGYTATFAGACDASGTVIILATTSSATCTITNTFSGSTATPTPTTTATASPTPTGTATATPTPTGNGNGGGQGRITICHHTSSATNPYVEITISVNGLNGHDHHDDIIPVPAGGCPSGSVSVGGTVVICVPVGANLKSYVKKTIDLAKDNLQQLLNGGSIILPATGCPSEVSNQTGATIDICQATGVSANPYLPVTVSVSALSSYLNGTNIIPMPLGGCPTNIVNVTSPVLICVATGNVSSPYSLLAVSQANLWRTSTARTSFRCR